MELTGDELSGPRIYLDHAATTPLAAEALAAMLPMLGEHWGNPSSAHARGRAARTAVDGARDTLAAVLGCAPREIILTGGGTESDNLALRGSLQRWGPERGRHLVVSAIEHEAVLATAAALAGRAEADVTVVGCDGDGRVDPERVAAAVRPDTVLVSVMLANNEVGTVQDVAAVAALARAANPAVLVHTDAVQAFGRVPLDIEELGVDLLSVSAHKCYGPKGCGLLYARWGTHLATQLDGGGQERGRRSGTENVAGIVGFAAAAALVCGERDAEARRQGVLRDSLEAAVMAGSEAVRVAGAAATRLPNLGALLVDGVSAEPLVAGLDMLGVEVSSGSACSSGAAQPSHVLAALGVDTAATALLRVSLGRGTTAEEVELAAALIVTAVAHSRAARGAARPAVRAL